MKVCPHCGTRYTDETLQYCLQDGKRLQQADPIASVPPADEPETVVRKRPSDSVVPVNAGRPRTGLIVVLTALTTLLLVVFGLGAWLLMRGRSNQADNAQNNAANTTSPERSPLPTPSPTAISNSINSPANTSSPTPANTGSGRREVTQFIANWKSATESKNIDSYIGQYADTVAYYNDPSASREDVRNDKRRAFSIYDHIRLNISNINTDVAPDGETAVSTFDKEWEFVGDKNSKGKVRSELRLKKFDGKWKIVGERDQRVYYVE